MIEARPAELTEIRTLAATLARAFYDDPVTLWILPDEAGRTARLARMFNALIRHHHFAGGGVEVAPEGTEVGAAALWDPPNRWRQSPREQLAMMPSMIRTFGLRSARPRQVVDVMKDVHPDEPHWYLAVIGSDPTVRGKGFGQALMRSGLDRCDAEHCPAYLESSKPENVPYYQRFGFEVTGVIELPDDGPTVWPMWRAPR